jgi:hypothetical protein
MPKQYIDYSNTVIYKIICKDLNVNDVYVGHTTNLQKRKYQHKIRCKNNNLRLYKFIREHGGWDNWDMIEIAKYNLKDATEARMKEQEHYDLLKAKLNCLPPYKEKKSIHCKCCNIYFIDDKLFQKHIETKKHLKKLQKDPNVDIIDNCKFKCPSCDFSCCKKSEWTRHILTRKHKNQQKSTENQQNAPREDKLIYECICGKIYKERTGLWRHKKKCFLENKNIDQDFLNALENNDNQLTDKDIIVMLLKQNNEFKELLVEQNKSILDISSKFMNP